MKQHKNLNMIAGSIPLAGKLLPGALLLGSIFAVAQTAPSPSATSVVPPQGGQGYGAQGYRTSPPPNPTLIKDANPPKDVVDIELLTWPELYKKIHEEGKTTAIVFNGDTEQRGPQDVIGGHSFIAHGTAELIAKKLGNALVAPVLFHRGEPGSCGTADPQWLQKHRADRRSRRRSKAAARPCIEA